MLNLIKAVIPELSLVLKLAMDAAVICLRVTLLQSITSPLGPPARG